MSSASVPFHSVRLDADKCVGCTTCIKKCPTQAIRVRKGRASIIAERCIDCGECIRTCPHGAKKAVSDPLSIIDGFRYRVAMPAPALYSQFDESQSVDLILSGLLELGFDEVFEVAEAAELVTEATKQLLADSQSTGALPRPLISSACPAVVRIVQLRFPSLIPHLVPLIPPMEAAARIVKETLHRDRPGVGVFFITPCAGKVTVTRSPLGYPSSALDGVIGLKDIYLPLLNAMSAAPLRKLARAGRIGLEWARTEGESEAVGQRSSISVDGIANVIGVLEALEKGKLGDLKYIEALACPAGCVGGPLTVENPFIARTRLRKREDEAPPQTARPRTYEGLSPLAWSEPVKPRSALVLDADMARALVMMEELDMIAKGLPGLDCGSCGAPSCDALAEDVVRGSAVATDCIFKLRENVRKLAGELLALEERNPPGLDREL
ncbi:MAG TPA: [Fe-Fe] hydrogenase large subunit C-terminal domain-containing protein [Rectinemataceae bacterium]|nr:[Fe-Fe] hydrogenase large subunit C-terminal domain-containing protein [Rectinemataceae bacterium]